TKTIKFLPKAGEYVVHSIHGIGKCEGLVNMTVGGVDKEFFKITYRGGDTLYVPYEQADSLSLYLSEGNSTTLNKLGGKEFAMQKLRAQKSIEDMSQELLELYAKRKISKGFKYPEDDYLYTEFENAFAYVETNDQLHAIADIKKDMISGRVMDRLICGDVGFGKTEVAMRAMFKTVQAGKQVAILAPTTILSMQHFMTASERVKDFGVKVEMLNRFRSNKEQKQIIEDLHSGKIDVICGTHRLLSEDIKFNDLGLLILDEEQRFGVKAKEHIKNLKNNVNVLTLSATPIPRTLSMSMMQIRDISIINTPPTERKAVKTYVLGYNQDFVLNAIKEELNRSGQTLIVFNNIEYIYKLASTLEKALNDKRAKFDVAHGQMTETALENAIKKLYNKETNVFVSTTLIENGVDLPNANTLIVVESDKLGLSQMYQLRGRVGRSNEQAFAYFTYNKDKMLTEDASNRLQAIAENTELGSGFKIAMRDLQIRGAGELLGKVQHGHMIKIGYDMYAKLLNETLRKLKGEKVETYRDIKLDIALNYIIPKSFLIDETERLKVIAKISNITSRDDIRTILGELINEYGKLPKEIYHLANVSLMKSLAEKQSIKHIIINKNNMSIIYYSDIDVNKLIKKVNKFGHFKFVNSSVPTISLDCNYFTVQSAMNYMIEFLIT
ncbi:MAG: transcription-repair coupling factor, partial [Clostridia bacterium]|nr:transcription-repair coupling factor [Clostridia bacterium]